ncbi:MAG: hypothetical protein ACT4QD_10460 [Acidobacteriota bacterium]
MRRDGSVGVDRPYLTASAAVVVVMTLQTINQQWSGDFWEHAAVIRELAQRPWAPRHPLFGIDAPHPFLSPYSLAGGLIARAVALSPVTVLGGFGLLNLAALLVSFHLFVGHLLGPRSAFYGLLLTLVWWGFDPWRYSGFLHLNALGFTLAYPSIFAMWLTLLALYAAMRFFETRAARWAALVSLIGPLVLLVHPITSLVLAAGLVALSVGQFGRARLAVAGLGVAVSVASLAGVLLWPYYPWLALIQSGSAVYAEPNLAMYDDVLRRTWPILVALPLVVRRWARDPSDALAALVAMLGGLYALGAVLQNGPLGRVLPALAMSLHLVIADAVAHLEMRATTVTARRRFAAAVVIALLVGTANMAPGLVRAVPRALLPPALAADPRLERAIDLYGRIGSFIGPDDIVMADLNVSRHLPAFAGKVVAFIDPEAFVPDEHDRRQATNRYFSDISTEERRALAKRFGATFVVVDRRTTLITESLRLSLATLGEVVHDDGRLVVVKLAS